MYSGYLLIFSVAMKGRGRLKASEGDAVMNIIPKLKNQFDEEDFNLTSVTAAP